MSLPNANDPRAGILLGALDETEMSDEQRAFYGKRKGQNSNEPE